MHYARPFSVGVFLYFLCRCISQWLFINYIVCLNKKYHQCLALTFPRKAAAKKSLQSALSPEDDLSVLSHYYGQAGLSIFLWLVVIQCILFE